MASCESCTRPTSGTCNITSAKQKELEDEAVQLHTLARQLNEQGKYEEAKATYRQMYAVEDQALHLAAAEGADAVSSPIPQEYDTLQPFPPLLTFASPLPSHPQQQQQLQEQAQEKINQIKQGIKSRALGAILGSIVGDAAAMGVHWIYSEEELERLLEARRKEKEGENEENNAAPAPAPPPPPPSPSPPSSISTSDNNNHNQDEDKEIGLEFYKPPHSPFFSYPSGRPSPYGEQTKILLSSLSHHHGLNPHTYAHTLAQTYGKGWDGYRDASIKGFLRRWYVGERPPMCGAEDWQANCFTRVPPLVAGFVSVCAGVSVCDGTDEDGEAVVVVAVDKGGKGVGEGEVGENVSSSSFSSLRTAVEHATRVTQNTDKAVAWAWAAAEILARLVVGVCVNEGDGECEDPPILHLPSATNITTIEAAIKAVLANLQKEQEETGGNKYKHINKDIIDALTQVLSLHHAHKDVHQAVAILGRNCHLPNSFQTPLHAALFHTHTHTHTHNDTHLKPKQANTPTHTHIHTHQEEEEETRIKQNIYKQAIRAALREGGCCASRAGFTGACLGAIWGPECVPEEWKREVSGWERCVEMAEELVEGRK